MNAAGGYNVDMLPNAELAGDLVWVTRRVRPAVVLLYLLLIGVTVPAVQRGALFGVMAFDGGVRQQYLLDAHRAYDIQAYGGSRYGWFQFFAALFLLTTQGFYVWRGWRLMRGGRPSPWLQTLTAMAAAVPCAAVLMAGVLLILPPAVGWSRWVVDANQPALLHLSITVPALRPQAYAAPAGLLAALWMLTVLTMRLGRLTPRNATAMTGYSLAVLAAATATLALSLARPMEPFGPFHTAAALSAAAVLWTCGAMAGMAMLAPLKQLEQAGETCPSCGTALGHDASRDCPACGTFLGYRMANLPSSRPPE